jgi:hypothetical protein
VDEKAECKDRRYAYNFFMCLLPGELQDCYDMCEAASDAMLQQFNVCAATAAVSCDMSCFKYL